MTDAGVVHLTELKQLVTLDPDGTRITWRGFELLRNAIPALQADPGLDPQFAQLEELLDEAVAPTKSERPAKNAAKPAMDGGE